LDQRRLDECWGVLEKIDGVIRTETDRGFYGHRAAEFTKTRLFIHQGCLPEALGSANSVLRLAELTGDEILLTQAMLAKAEALQLQGNRVDSTRLLNQVSARLPLTGSPDLYAEYERVLSVGLALTDETEQAAVHRERAKRINESLPNIPGLLALDYSWRQFGQSELGRQSAKQRNLT
jgi:hypothetical protein